MEIKTEADSNDITECPHDDKLTTGMFGLSDVVFCVRPYTIIMLQLSSRDLTVRDLQSFDIRFKFELDDSIRFESDGQIQNRR